MKYEIVKDVDMSGNKCSIYTVFVEEYGQTLFERFLEECSPDYPDDVQNILDRLEVIAHDTGARRSYFKEKEGKPGDLVCALFDTPDKNLRLYCIRYGGMLILLGGGGPKNERAWQDNEKLTEEAKWMIKVSREIYERQLNKEVWFTSDDLDFEGELKFGYHEENE